MDAYRIQDSASKKGAWKAPLMIFIVIFACLTVGCICLIFNRPKGSGPKGMNPMTKEKTSANIGAMLDPNREIRGIWIPSVLNITFPSRPGLSAAEMRKELDDIVKTARDANLNTVCLQVRPSADALYDSDYFPTSAYLSGTQGVAADENFDPLAYLCSIAHSEIESEALAVYAWVNPLRVTSVGQDISLLSNEHPAVVHPEWTFTYNRAVYFNAGIPEVRALVTAGVREICEKYPVAGVIFDDYFYPYPVSNPDGSGTLLPLEDADTYAVYGTGYQSVADFRRGNINSMIEDCYHAVKAVSEYIQFGIAPFGIWQNANDENGGSGSDTSGLEAYHSLYCDALAWMEGGYIDFIAPQIYWQFTTKAARYDTLVRWWNAQCDAYGIPMWVSHAIYQYENWNTPGEMRNQIAFARAETCYRGSLFYGYPQLKENTCGIAEELRSAFCDDILYYEKETVWSEEEKDITETLHITMPQNNSRFDENGTYIMGQSDPGTPLFCDGMPVSRTKSGYFVIYKPLARGENTFLFSQNGTELPFTVWNGQYAPVTNTPAEPELPSIDTETESTAESTALPPLTASFSSPKTLTAVPWEEGISVAVRATANARVTVTLGQNTVELAQEQISDDGSGTALYTAALPLEACEDNAFLHSGTLSASVHREEDDAAITIQGADIYALGSGAMLPVMVTEDSTSLKIAPDSWYYDDYIPASKGMTAEASSIRNGYARIALAGNTAYLDAAKIAIPDTEQVQNTTAQFGAVTVEQTERETILCIPSTENVPVNCMKNGSTFTVTLYHGETTASNTESLAANPLFDMDSVVSSSGAAKGNAYTTYTFQLYERDRFFGFTVSYTENRIQIALRNPMTYDKTSDTPLAGKTIVLDAGHGGTDTGTLTPGSHLAQNEKDCNLAIVLEAEKRLQALGADVILLREDDTTVDIYSRMEEIDRIAPDLLVSIHQNAMTQNTDVSHIRGVVGLYWTESGRSLADCVAEKIAEALGRLKRDTTSQRLAMLRNYKFPSALIEVGFVTNPEEFEILCAPGGYEKTAQAVCDGILAWFDLQTQSVQSP